MNAKLKLLGFLINKDLAEKNVSSTNGLLYHHLKDKNAVVEIIDVNLKGIRNKINIVKNFSTNYEVWMFKLMLDVKRKIMMSKLAQESVMALPKDKKFNAVLQIGSEFSLDSIKELKNVPRFSYHDNNILAYLQSDHKKPNLSKRISDIINFEKSVYDKLDGIFTMTDFLKQVFIKGFKIPEKKVHSIGFAANLDSVMDIDKEYDGKTILFVAKDSFKEKGGLVLLDAFKKVKKEIKDVRLIIVGQKIDCKIDGVENIGFIDKRTIDGESKFIQFYKKASLFVMPSYVDAAGSVFLEAMSFKVPCIGTNVSAMPEIIVGNHCGVVTNTGDSNALADAIIMLLRDAQLLKEFGENGYKAVKEKYNWEVVCDKFIQIASSYL